MTDGQQNQDDLPEEDWAMSVPENPAQKEPEAAPIDEAAAKLYAPPDTGDLEGWDIGTDELKPIEEIAQHSHKPANQESFEDLSFVPPMHSFEIISPLQITERDENDWNASPPPSDGWKMPAPTFRASEGRVFGTGKKQRFSNEGELRNPDPVPENLPDIYAPPDTEEYKESTEELSFSEVPGGVPDEPGFENDQSNLNSEVESLTSVAAVPAKKGKTGFLMWGIIAIGLLAVILAGAVFAVFYYSSQH